MCWSLVGAPFGLLIPLSNSCGLCLAPFSLLYSVCCPLSLLSDSSLLRLAFCLPLSSGAIATPLSMSKPMTTTSIINQSLLKV
jgi:hypothetical protein